VTGASPPPRVLALVLPAGSPAVMVRSCHDTCTQNCPG
jgi:hypothetical protein